MIRSLGPAIRSTSALVFLTLLWQAFGLLEQVDMSFTHKHTPRSTPSERLPRQRQSEEEGEGEGEEIGEGLVFGMTWVEFIHNAVLLGCWTSTSPLSHITLDGGDLTVGWSDRALTAYTALGQVPNELGMEFSMSPSPFR